MRGLCRVPTTGLRLLPMPMRWLTCSVVHREGTKSLEPASAPLSVSMLQALGHMMELAAVLSPCHGCGEMARIPSGETRACFPLIPPCSYPASLHRAGGRAAGPLHCCAPGPLQEAGLGDRRKEKPTPCPGRQSLGPRISARQHGRLSRQMWFPSAVLSIPPFSDRWFILLITSPCP